VRNGYIFTSEQNIALNTAPEWISAMPRFSCKKPYHWEIFSRQVEEIRNLLHVLEMREGMDDSENRPRMDMFETAEEIVLEFDLPGFRPDEISLTISGITLVLEAQKPREQAEGRFICLERRFGLFRSVVQIPGNISPCSINAEYRMGVLRVTCPKSDGMQVPIKEITL
jgi:HSP20 family protein